MILFSLYYDVYTRYEFGKSLLIPIGLILIVNVCFSSYWSFKDLLRKRRLDSKAKDLMVSLKKLEEKQETS
jgi:hypothetical protein